LLGTLAALLALGALLAWRIRTWGRPLPLAYRLVGVSPGGNGGGRSYAYLREGPSPGAGHRTVALDTDSDGTLDQFLREGGRASSFSRPAAGDLEARWLILCLDGVPFEEVEALWAEGHFREFFRPVPVISPFPSASGLALSALFHTGPVAGYEDGYFDRARNELSGGALKTSTQADMPYVELLDYDLPGWSRGLAYVMPVKSYRADLGRLRQRFLASSKKVFLAHLATSDSIYHVVPRAQARALLQEVNALARELYFDAGGKLRITLFSDHGNSLVQNRSVPLRAHLEARDWRLTKQLGGARDIVVPTYGLMGFFAVYAAPGAQAALARDLAAMEGVDVAVFADGESVVIESARGRAHVEWMPDGARYRYLTESGDPLELAESLASLKRDKKSDTDGWVSDADWFAATAGHRLPDPLHRLREWATNHVRNRADLVVSLKPGYHQGSASFDRLVTMLSTHGSFDRAQSLGFAMSTDGPLAGAIRNDQLFPDGLGKRKAEK